MKTIIAGSRTGISYEDVVEAIEKSGFMSSITEVVSGMAKGVDSFGETWAEDNHIPIALFPADWDIHGKKAGHLRNVEMGDYADALIAVWDGESRGTKHMINYAKKIGMKVYVHIPNEISIGDLF